MASNIMILILQDINIIIHTQKIILVLLPHQHKNNLLIIFLKNLVKIFQVCI